MSKNKGGKPLRVLDAAEVAQVEKLSAVLSKEQLSAYLSMADNTFRAIEKRQPEVAEAFARGKAKAIAGVAGNLVNQAINGNIAAAIFYLKTQAGWSETKEPEATSDDQIRRIEIEVVGANSKD